MKKLTTALKIFGILLIIIVILAATLPFAFKKQIVGAVKTGINDQITAKLEFSDYSLSLFRSFPNFSLGLKKLTLIGTGDFAKDTLISTQELQLTIDLISVIKGKQYVVTKVSLDEPSIMLRVLKNGKANWDITKPSPPAATTAAESNAKFRLTVNKFEINGGKVVYDDQSMGMKTAMTGLDLFMKADINGDVYEMQTEVSTESLDFAYGGVPYLHKVNAGVKTDITADMKAFKFSFKDAAISLNALDLGLDGWFSMPEDDINMDLKFDAGKSEFKNFLSLLPAVYAKDFDKVKTAGSLTFNGYAKGVYNDNMLPAFGINLLVNNAMFQYPGLPATVKNIGIDLNLANKNGVPDNTLINLRKLHLEAGSNVVDASMQVATPVSDPAIKAKLKAAIKLAEVKQFYPLPDDAQLSGLLNADIQLDGKMSSIDKKQYEAFKAAGDISLSLLNYKSKDLPQGLAINTLKLIFSPSFVEMPVCDLRLGRSDMKATGRLDNALGWALRDEVLKGNFESSSRLMDLNEFMAEDAAPSSSDTLSTLTVMRLPANIDFVAKTAITKLIYDNIQMSNVSGGLRIADEKISLNNLQMNMLGGSMVMNGTYDSKPQSPNVAFNLDIKRFDIPLTARTFNTVKKLAPVASYCAGKASTTMNFTASLDDKMMPILESLNGSGMIKGEQLVVMDFIPMNKLSEALKIDKFKKLDIGTAMMDVTITKGRVVVKPFTFMTDNIKSTIGGWNDLDQQISYTSVMEIPRAMFGTQANSALEGMIKKAGTQGVKLNIGETIIVSAKILGTFTNPTITTDLKNSANAALTEVKQQVEQEVKKKVQEEIVKVKADAGAEAAKIIADAEKKAAELNAAAKAAGDKLVAEADKEGKNLVAKASDPLSKLAAKEAAKQALKQAQSKSDKLQKEADQKGKAIIAAARAEAARLK